MKLLLNGSLKDSKEAVISVYDHGFLYGMGLFETFRTYGGRPWLLERHAGRLAAGCRALGIDYVPDPARMRAGIESLLEANGLADAYVRWSVSAGEGAVGLPSGPYGQPAEIVYAKELAPDSPDTRAGKTLRLLKTCRSSFEGEARLKSFQYMNNILAKRELQAAGAPADVEGLFLNGDEFVCEGIVSNVFWVLGGMLRTPSLETGPLPGITREYVLELASSMGVRTMTGHYEWVELVAAEEIFLTNSVQEIVPVRELQDEEGETVRMLDSAGAGTVTRLLMEKYRDDAERG